MDWDMSRVYPTLHPMTAEKADKENERMDEIQTLSQARRSQQGWAPSRHGTVMMMTGGLISSSEWQVGAAEAMTRPAQPPLTHVSYS